MRFVLGLTGGIASGKTVVSDIMQNSGIKIIDADHISRQVTKEGSECNEKVKSAFFSCVKDDILDRKALREIVFSDENARQLLNSITHPYIFAQIKYEIEKEQGFVVLSAPLLFECGLNSLCDKVLVVVSDEEIRIKRIASRDNISNDLAKSMIKSQMSDTEKIHSSDFVIFNNDTFNSLEKTVNNFLQTVMGDKY